MSSKSLSWNLKRIKNTHSSSTNSESILYGYVYQEPRDVLSNLKWVGSSMFDLDASVVFPAIPPAILEIDRLLPLLGCKSGGGGLKWTDFATNST